MAVATTERTAIARTFDWFGSDAAHLGLRVTVPPDGGLDPWGRPDPGKRGFLLINREGSVVSADGYCRHLQGRRVWIEASDDSPIIEIFYLDSNDRTIIHLSAGAGRDGDALMEDEGLQDLVATSDKWRQCLRCGTWRPNEDEHMLCGACQHVLAFMDGRLHDGGHGYTWRQCDACGGWYRDPKGGVGIGVCDSCHNNGDGSRWNRGEPAGYWNSLLALAHEKGL